MRPLEILIVLLNLAALLMVYMPSRFQQRWFKFLPAAIVGITLAHLLLEQYRWQMVLAYLMTAVLFLRALPSLVRNSGMTAARGAWAVIAGGFACIWWLVALALPIILPVPHVPTPPGPYAVGSVLYDWTDLTRAEIYSSDPQAKREVMVQIWYPAQPDAAATPMPLMDHLDVALPALAQSLGLPSFALDHLRLITTHT